MIHTLRRASLGAGLVLVTVLAGCSSSGADDGSTTGGPTASGGGSAPDTATTKAVSRAYRVFFDTDTPLGVSVKVLQHGSKFRPTLNKESGSNYGKQKTRATVSAVTLTNPRVAHVTFSIKVGGRLLLPDSPGYAVRDGGTWKVAAQTFCELLTLEGTAPTLCKNKSITALTG